MAGRIHADSDDDNFQSGSADQVDTSYAFHNWYAGNRDKLMDLTRVSEFNSGIMLALQIAYEAGMENERAYVSKLEGDASSVTRIVTPEGKLIRTVTAHRAG